MFQRVQTTNQPLFDHVMTWPFGHRQAVPDDRTEAERRVERVVAEARNDMAARKEAKTIGKPMESHGKPLEHDGISWWCNGDFHGIYW